MGGGRDHIDPHTQKKLSSKIPTLLELIQKLRWKICKFLFDKNYDLKSECIFTGFCDMVLKKFEFEVSTHCKWVKSR